MICLHAIALENTESEEEYSRLISSMFSSTREQQLWTAHPFYNEWRSIHHEGLPLLIINSDFSESRDDHTEEQSQERSPVERALQYVKFEKEIFMSS